eukprot:TRINITY_DN15982_c0_g1_i1.p1 TRINITY_DN15982_c0_g1~~TRINITY_DN15982_c0_g1_i1.p1  ORF type:complete len:309 (-),score=44.02 TRINITY_DN15982_c0_g1_i1:138-1064(-)
MPTDKVMLAGLPAAPDADWQSTDNTNNPFGSSTPEGVGFPTNQLEVELDRNTLDLDRDHNPFSTKRDTAHWMARGARTWDVPESPLMRGANGLAQLRRHPRAKLYLLAGGVVLFSVLFAAWRWVWVSSEVATEPAATGNFIVGANQHRQKENTKRKQAMRQNNKCIRTACGTERCFLRACQELRGCQWCGGTDSEFLVSPKDGKGTNVPWCVGASVRCPVLLKYIMKHANDSHPGPIPGPDPGPKQHGSGSAHSIPTANPVGDNNGGRGKGRGNPNPRPDPHPGSGREHRNRSNPTCLLYTSPSPRDS